MKIILNFIILLLFLLIPRHLNIPLKINQCIIGISEANFLKNQTHKSTVPLISYDEFHIQILSLLKNDKLFNNVIFTNTSTFPNTSKSLLLPSGSCIKLQISDQNIQSIVFLSHNNKVEWQEINQLMQLIKPLNSQEHWHDSDIYKIAVNISDMSKHNLTDGISSNIYSYSLNLKKFHNLTLFNKKTNKVSIFLYKTST